MKPPKRQGTAEWTGKTVRFRIARDLDPSCKWQDLRNYIGDRMSKDPTEALEEGKRLAHELSLKAREKHAARAALASSPKSESVAAWSKRWRAWRVRMRYVVSEDDDAKNFRNYIEPVIGHRPMRIVDAAEIEKVVEGLDARIVSSGDDALSWKTARNAWTCLRAMFRDASSAKGSSGLRVRDDNPTLAVAPPERPKKGSGNKLLTFLYPSDYLTLVTAPTIWDAKQGLAKRHNANVARAKAAKRWMRIFTLCVYNCLRARELKGLRWEWCDLEHWVGKVELQANTNRDAKRTGKEDKDPKAGSFREFDFEPMVRPLMVKMHAEAKAAAGGKEPTGRIFPSFPGGKDLSSRLRKYLELAGCTRADLHTRNAHRVRMRFHDLRATSATWMAMRGDDPIHIQEVAGHASLATTEQYIRRVRRLRGADWGTPFPPIPSVVLDGWPAEKSEGGRPKTPAAAHKKERAAKGRDQAGTKTGPKITQAHVIAKTKSVPKGIRSVKPCSNQGKNVPLWSGRDQNRARSTSNAAPLLVPDAIAAALRSGLETAITEGRTGDAAALATELAARTRAVSDSKIVQLAGRRR